MDVVAWGVMDTPRPHRTTEPVPSTEGAAPDSGRRFVPDTEVMTRLGQVARSRAAGWRLCAWLVSPPDPELVEALRTGRLAHDLTTAVSWLGQPAEAFLPTAMTLDTYARRAARRAPEEDLADLAAEHARLWPDGVAWTATADDLAAVARQEAEAWENGDHERAKELRLVQQQRMEEDLVDTLPAWAVAAEAAASVVFYRAAARHAVLHLSFESGRDLAAAAFGGATGSPPPARA